VSGVCEAEARETVWLPLCESKIRFSVDYFRAVLKWFENKSEATNEG
jgi:hypothetical protein